LDLIETDLTTVRSYITTEREALKALKQKLAPIRGFFDNSQSNSEPKTSTINKKLRSVNFSAEIGTEDNNTSTDKNVEMVPITLTELDGLPKYLRGRLTIEKINAFVRDFNRFTSEKYAILLRSNPAKLSTDQRQKFFEWKNLECDETDGKRFITEADLKSKSSNGTGSFKFDQVARNILTILRHIGRIKEVRSVGIIRYLIN